MSYMNAPCSDATTRTSFGVEEGQEVAHGDADDVLSCRRRRD